MIAKFLNEAFFFSGVNTVDGSVVALKYQKPPNSWELYICTEVRKRLNNTDIVIELQTLQFTLKLTVQTFISVAGFYVRIRSCDCTKRKRSDFRVLAVRLLARHQQSHPPSDDKSDARKFGDALH